jgi:hypothetical protein
MPRLAAVMNASVDRFIAILEEAEACGKPIDIWARAGGFTLDVVGRTAFGVDLHTQQRCEGDAAMNWKVSNMCSPAVTYSTSSV